jgi:hypothetical protein
VPLIETIDTDRVSSHREGQHLFVAGPIQTDRLQEPGSHNIQGFEFVSGPAKRLARLKTPDLKFDFGHACGKVDRDAQHGRYFGEADDSPVMGHGRVR